MSENLNENLADDFLFSGVKADDETMSVFDNKPTINDGIYRPKLTDAKDKKIGYRATLRFLPNILENGKIGPSAIEKHVHYVDIKNVSGISGYYDCKKNYDKDCPLCTEYWKLFNSKNAADNAKAQLLNRTTKYYSYVLIVEDEQYPDLVGKVLVYPYGYTIKNKINSERQGEVSGKSVNVFDIIYGKDFKLIIKEKAGYQNYDTSAFTDTEPLRLYDEKKEIWRSVPIDENGKISNSKVQIKIKEFLTVKEVNLDDYKPKIWDDEMLTKINSIFANLNGEEVYVANQQATSTEKKEVESFQNDDVTAADDFFSID